jgi:hypothetical protein
LTRDFSTRPRRVSSVPQILWVAPGVVALLLSGAAAVHARHDLSLSLSARTEASANLERDKERARALQSTKWPLDELLALQIVQGAEAPPVAVLSALEKILPDDVKLVSVGLTYSKQIEIDMRVTARRPEAYDEFLARLDASSSFRDIVPAAESREGAVTATVTARFRSLP